MNERSRVGHDGVPETDLVATRAPWRRGALVLGAAIGLAGGYSAAYFGTLSVFLKEIAQGFGWTRASASGVVVLAQIGIALGAPFVGRGLDRFGARVVIPVSVALFALGLFTLTVLPASLALFGATSLVIGLVAVATTPVGYLSVVSRAFDRRLGLALGFAMLGLGCGTVVLPPLVQRWIAAGSWASGYRSLALFVLASGTAAWLLVFVVGRGHAPAVVRRDAAEAPVPPGIAFRDGVRDGRFWLLAAVFFVVATAGLGAIVHIVPMLSDRGMSPAEAVRGASLIGIGVMAGRFCAGAAMDLMPARVVAAFAFVMGGAGLLLLALHPQGSFGVIAAAAVLLGLAIGAEGDFLPFFVRRYFGVRHLGLFYGVLLAVYSLGGVAGPVLYGMAFDRLHDYGLALGAGVVACVLAAIAVLAVGPYRFAAPGTR